MLGGFQVSLDGRIVDDRAWGRRKAASLVKLLALEPRHRLHREAIREYLWPEQDPDSSAANLRVVLHAARRALHGAGGQGQHLLQVVNDEIVLQTDGQPWVDVVEFEREAARAQSSQAPDDYRRALALYLGELLPADRYEDWAVGRRERLHETYIALLVGLAAVLDKAGDAPGVIEALERALAGDPTNEQAAAHLMEAYARTGQRPRALRLFQQLREALERELDAAPDDELRRRYGEILANRGAPPVPIVEAPDSGRRRSNVRVPLTRFFGRTDQIARVLELLADARLVTLTGAGGSGKTRLAIAVADAAPETVADEVCWVELSALIDPEAIPQSIASALELRLDPALEAPAALAEGLAGRRLLLVLDNCEHLIEACARLADRLLGACPHLRILATSREPLHIAGETVLRVPALPLPPAQATSESEIASSEAVQLFCDRARFVQPDFELTPANAATIAAICRRLDGLPLAIELAAARASLLSLDQLAERLQDPLQVLAGGRRTDEPRQQTLRATLDWSFELLDAPEQSLLARLSVFAGGWDLDAAEAVCSGAGVDRRDVLGLLAQLVDKSLVEARVGLLEARYGLLETVRQYAGEKLETAGETERVRELHAAHFLAVAESGGAELTGPRQTEWLARLEQDHDNLRAALRWSLDVGRVEIAGRICAAVWRFWGYRSYLAEGEHWIQDALEHEASRALSSQLRARLYQGAAALVMNQGLLERSSALSKEALGLFEQAGDRAGTAATLQMLGTIAAMQDKRAEAKKWSEASLRVREEIGDVWGMANTLLDLSNLARDEGQFDQAEALCERSRALHQQVGNKRGMAVAIFSLGVNALDRRDYARTVELTGQALEIFDELGDHTLIGLAHNNLGYAEMHRGNFRQAAAHQVESLGHARAAGDHRGQLYSLEGLAGALALSGSPLGMEQAARIYGATDAARARLDMPIPPPDRVLNEQPIAAARAALGTERFASAWAEGSALDLDEVTDLALALADPQTSPVFSAPGAAPSPLSQRELEVARLIAREMTNQQIASTLGLSPRTAETHVRNILRKLGLSSRQEVADWIVRQGLVAD